MVLLDNLSYSFQLHPFTFSPVVLPEDYFAREGFVQESPVKQLETTSTTPIAQSEGITNEEIYKRLWTEHDQKLKHLESMIQDERRATEEIRAKVKELEEKLTVVPHPFHNFVTQLYYDEDVEYETKESTGSVSSDTDSIPETPISPFIKRRKTELFEIGVMKPKSNGNEFAGAKRRSSPKPRSEEH